jgi:hypothetical protein
MGKREKSVRAPVVTKIGFYLRPALRDALKRGRPARGLSRDGVAMGILWLAVDDENIRTAAATLGQERSPEVAAHEIRAMLVRWLVQKEVAAWVETLTPAERGRVLAELEAGKTPSRKGGK